MSEPVCASDSSAGSMKKPEELTVVDAPAGARVDEIDGLPKNLRFALYDAFFIVYSIFTYLLDIGSDIWLAHRYYVLEDYAFFGLTIGIVIFTSLVLTVLSWVWYKDDAKGDPVSPRDWRLRILLLLLQLAPVLRYTHALKYGFRFRALLRKRGVKNYSIPEAKATVEEKKLYDCMVKQDADASLLRLVETFVESGPQMLMQFYILVRHGEIYADESPLIVYVQVGSIVTSVISMAWAISAYSRSSRFALPSKQNISWRGTFILFSWHLFILTARVLALGLFSVAYKWWVFVVVGIHVSIIWLWAVFIMKTSACDHRYKEVFFNILVALIYIFQYLNINDEPTLWRYAPFYILMFLENAILVTMWFGVVIRIQLWYKVWAFVGHFVAFAIGIIFMLFYYLFFHPTKNIRPSFLGKYRSRHLLKSGGSSFVFIPPKNGVIQDEDEESGLHLKIDQDRSTDNN